MYRHVGGIAIPRYMITESVRLSAASFHNMPSRETLASTLRVVANVINPNDPQDEVCGTASYEGMDTDDDDEANQTALPVPAARIGIETSMCHPLHPLRADN
jgi:hypothetical protein